MGVTTTVLSQVVIMFLLLSVGFFCYKKKIINEETSAQMSEVLLMIVTPAVIIKAFQMEFKMELVKGLLISFLFAIISHIVGIVISHLIIRKQPNGKEYCVERFACVYGNSGFMGIPLIAAVLPDKGVFFASIFIAVFNIFMWTHGITLMTGKFTTKDFLKLLKSPPIISVIVGILIFILQIKLPFVISTSIGYIADLNTPLAMIITGIYIAKSNLLSAFTDKKIYKVAFVRLLFIPFIMIVIYMFINVTDSLKTIIIANLISTSCPTAASTLLLATKFRANPEHASKIVAASTAFSIITIPIVMFIMERMIGRFPLI